MIVRGAENGITFLTAAVLQHDQAAAGYRGLDAELPSPGRAPSA